MPLGVYISVPFCKSKCSYCNFASDVFPSASMESYTQRLVADIDWAERRARQAGGNFQRAVDTIYLGGGTPSLLEPRQMEQIFAAVRRNFDVASDAEITAECAPGTLSPAMVETLLRCGVGRISLGVQSFVDAEARAVGRLHTREMVSQDVAHLRSAGITNINVDLIAGLPHQRPSSWEMSLSEALALGVPHISVYLLEVDEDSRLGRELLAGGARYHAHFVPDEGMMADFYGSACELLAAAGMAQYEISNFARPGMESRHNLKYWTRQPYLGFGVDAHSMLRITPRVTPRITPRAVPGSRSAPPLTPRFESSQPDAMRLAMPDDLHSYMASFPAEGDALRGVLSTPVSEREAWEETFFLGLRLNRGVELREIEECFGPLPEDAREAIEELRQLQLLQTGDGFIRLTGRGRLLSNEVCQRFIKTKTKSQREEESASLVAISLVAISNRIQ
jgi:oxygen-independent coproporphyrinogen III oxidase